MNQPNNNIPRRPQMNMPNNQQPPNALASAAQQNGPSTVSTPQSAPTQNEGATSAPRPERIPFGAARQKLAATDRPGYHRRWFNDDGRRVDAAKAAGYTFVNDPRTGEPTKSVVGVAKSGGGQAAYLMEIPIELFDEDQRAKDVPLQQFDQDIRRGAGPGTAPGQDGRYVPMKPDGTPRIDIK